MIHLELVYLDGQEEIQAKLVNKIVNYHCITLNQSKKLTLLLLIYFLVNI